MVLELAQWNITPVSVFFILIFLPLSLFFYYVLPVRLRKESLIIISGIYLYCVVPDQLPLILGVTGATVVLGRKIAGLDKSSLKKTLLAFTIFINIFTWAFFSLDMVSTSFPNILGIGVFPLLGIYFAVECYKTEKKNLPIFSSSLLYLMFYPRLYVGPITSIGEFWKDGIDPSPAGENLKEGLEKFIRGSFQFAFLGTRLLKLVGSIAELRPQEITRISSWVMVLALIMGMYHIIAGFMLLSRGISEMYGMYLPKSVNAPFRATSIRDFAQRFNSHLVDFYEELVIKNIKVVTNNKYAVMAATVIIGGLIGLWYGFSLPFMVFGLFFGVFVVLEETRLNRYLENKKGIARAYTIIVLILGFSLLAVGEAGWNIQILKSLFAPFGGTLYNDVAVYLVSSNILILALSFILITNLPTIIEDWTKRLSSKIAKILSALLHLVLLGVLISLLV